MYLLFYTWFTHACQFAYLLGPILVRRTIQILSAVHNVFHIFQTHTNLSAVHNIFYISMLRKYTPDPSHMLAHDTISLREDLTYKEDLVQMLDREVKSLRNKEIALVKVLWNNHKGGSQLLKRERDENLVPDSFQS